MRVSYGDQQASTEVTVLADPRSANTSAEWQARWTALNRAGTLNDRAVKAIRRLRRTRTDIDVVMEKARQRARDAGEKDEKRIEEHPLIVAGKELEKLLGELERRLWNVPEDKGIAPDCEVLGPISDASGYLNSSWAPPTPAQLVYLVRAERGLDRFMGDYDAFFAGPVQAYVQRVVDTGIGLFHPPED